MEELIYQIWLKIAAYQVIILHYHVLPDYDALGSVFALQAIIRATWPSKEVYVAGGVSGWDLLPPGDILEDSCWSGALVIICDCSNKERVEDQRYLKGDLVIKIDHHRDFQPFGNLVWVDTTMVATAEMIYLLYLYGDAHYPLQIPQEAYLYLFAGMVTDSGNFRFVEKEQAARFYRHASQVVAAGNFSPREVMSQIFQQDEKILRYRGYLMNSFIRPVPSLVYAKVDAVNLEQLELSWQEAVGHVNSLMGIKGVLVWALFVEEPPERRILCELRSGGLVVNELAYTFGGGGHPLASGCSLTGWQQVDEVIAALHKLVSG